MPSEKPLPASPRTPSQEWNLRPNPRPSSFPVLILFTLLAGFTGMTSRAHAQNPEKPAIDLKASQLLKKMSDYLANSPKLSLTVDSSIQVVTKAGQKLNFDAESKVSIQRPNKLRSDREGEVAKLSFYYNGKEMALFGKQLNYFATTKAPPTLDEAIDHARNKLGIEAPGADLLVSKPYATLTEDVIEGTYIGETRINGMKAHHLAFRGHETDWQIWIADGNKPVPLKYVISSKNIHQAPEYEVEMRNWDMSPQFPEGFFTFTPPKDAMRVAFASDLSKQVDGMRTR